jgi:uncharacterized protein YaaW (UPF0174 family)
MGKLNLNNNADVFEFALKFNMKEMIDYCIENSTKLNVNVKKEEALTILVEQYLLQIINSPNGAIFTEISNHLVSKLVRRYYIVIKNLKYYVELKSEFKNLSPEELTAHIDSEAYFRREEFINTKN